jgi:type IV secretion system protein VirB3
MNRNQGITEDPLFVGMTRPPMKWGVTYAGLIVNVMVTINVFIITKNLVWLLAFVPIHGLMALVCLYEPMFFELLHQWGRTRGVGLVLGNARFWKANTYSPLRLDFPDKNGRRGAAPEIVIL